MKEKPRDLRRDDELKGVQGSSASPRINSILKLRTESKELERNWDEICYFIGCGDTPL